MIRDLPARGREQRDGSWAQGLQWPAPLSALATRHTGQADRGCECCLQGLQGPASASSRAGMESDKVAASSLGTAAQYNSTRFAALA